MAIALFGCFVVQMGLGCGYIFGVTLKRIVAELEWSRTAFSLGGAPLLLAMALSGPLVGTLCERIGARRVAAGGILLLGLSLALFGRMQGLVEFYVICALFGVGLTGVGDIVAGSVASAWVSGRRGVALALVYAGSNVGGMIIPIAVNQLAEIYSWRTALPMVGAAVVLLLLPAALAWVREPHEVPEGSRPPSDGGDGSAGTERDLDLGQALRTRSFWALGFVLFSFYFYYLAVNIHLVPHLTDLGVSDARAAAGLSFAVLLGVVAKLVIGWLADRYSCRPVMLLNFVVLTLGSGLLLLVDQPALLLIFLVAHGFSTAAENVLLPLMVAECFGVKHLARIFGVLMIMLFPGGVLGQTFAGAMHDQTGSYRSAFVTFAVLNVLSLLALLLVRGERKPALSDDGIPDSVL